MKAIRCCANHRYLCSDWSPLGKTYICFAFQALIPDVLWDCTILIIITLSAGTEVKLSITWCERMHRENHKMHHEKYNSSRKGRGVQKNIKIKHPKGAEVYLKSRALSQHHVCLYSLPPLCRDLSNWLTSEFPFFPSEEIPHPHVYFSEKKWIRPENMPPATLTPRAMVISIQVNITGSRFPIMFPHTASCCLRTQP